MLTPLQKKIRLFRAWTTRFPLWCAWQVTYRCNFRCSFCHYWADPMGLVEEPPASQYALGSRRLAGFGSMMVSLAGGEPFLRTDLPEIVSQIAKYNFPFVTTNGWFVTEKLARDLMRAGLWGVSISIDYSDPQKHDKRRGMDGAWKQAWRAVELFSKARVKKYQRVNVMCVLLDDNADDLEEIAKKAQQYGAYFMVQPYGFRKTGSRAFEHKGDPVSPRLLELRDKHPNFLSNPKYLSRFDEFLEKGIPGCMAGKAFFNIDSAGDIAICVERKNTPIANLYDDQRHTIRDRLRVATKRNNCTDCWYNCRGEIEQLYDPIGLVKSLPTYLWDRGYRQK